ncbi:MAG: hypothetical protein WD250_11395 [Egibacteraceae bacterium]
MGGAPGGGAPAPAPDRRSPQRTVVDLLFASSGVEPEIVAEAEALTVFADVTVGVVRTGRLLALKLLARADNRPIDARSPTSTSSAPSPTW